MNENRMAGLAIAASVLLVAVGIAAAMIVRPAEAVEPEPDWTWQVYPSDHTNTRALVEIKLQQLDDKLKLIGETETARLEAEQAEAEQAYYAQSYMDSYGGGEWYADYSAAYNSDGPSRTMPGWHDGRKETYYSSNVLYHYRTDEWTVDSEGFYRTDEGQYVVAASDMEQGTVFEGSKGECVVLDTGCPAGTTDYYVNWG